MVVAGENINSEARSFADELGATVIEMAHHSVTDGLGPSEVVVRFARVRGYPGVIWQSDPTAEVDFARSVKQLQLSSEYKIDSEPQLAIEESVDDVDQLLLGPESTAKPTLSIVMPTLNEEEGVKECIQQAKNAIAELGVTAEIILSDSSSDRTPEIGREMGAIVYEPDQPGYGYAYQYAFARARGDYIVMGDADTTYDFEQIPRLLEKLNEEDADIVMGSRLGGEIKSGAMPALHRYVGNPLLTKFLNVFYDASVSDAHSGFRLFTREALDTMQLETTGMEFASEMIMEAGSKGLHIVEIPIVYHERTGEETLDSFRDGWRHVHFMLKNAPGYLFAGPGIAMMGLGLLIMLSSALNVSIGGFDLGIQTMVGGSLLLVIGYPVACFGIFSSLVANPIRKPEDRITKWIAHHFRLEYGLGAGLLLVLGGGLGIGYPLMTGLVLGEQSVSSAVWTLFMSNVVAFGILTLFLSFLLDICQ